MAILLSIFMCSFCSITYLNIIKAEYQILGGVTPRFINYTYNISKQSFPNDIVIYISLSRVGGTLLYSVDRFKRQLIISLHDGTSKMMELEMNKQQFHTSLTKLCKCELCMFETLKLRIQVRETLNVQCNDGDMVSFIFTESGIVNQDYPIPTFNENDNVGAYLWLVNTPLFGNIYPNSAQLSGCIFNVTYKNVPLKMGTHEVGDKCPITCNGSVCHEGQCLETYNGAPLCNCTGSFKGGRLCSDEVVEQTKPSHQQFNFKGIKLSFTNTTGTFFLIKNKILSLRLMVQENNLVFVINCSNQNRLLKIEAILSQYYRKEDEHILLMEFHETIVDVKFRGRNKSWFHINIPHSHDIGREVFQELNLSGPGIIDMHYINVLKDFRWIKLQSINDTNTIKYGSGSVVTMSTTQGSTDLSTEDSNLPQFVNSKKLSDDEIRQLNHNNFNNYSGKVPDVREKKNERLIVCNLDLKVNAIIALILGSNIIMLILLVTGARMWKKRLKSLMFGMRKENGVLLLPKKT